MKRIRIGKDIYCRLTILTNGESISLKKDRLALLMVSPGNEKTVVRISEVIGNVLKFHIKPAMQRETGVYGFEVWKNMGTGFQSVCDKVQAFELVPLSLFEGGTEDWEFKPETVEMESNFSGEIVIINDLDSDRTDAALSANMGRVLKEMIESTGGNLEAETEERKAADEELQTAISEEATAREDADATLQANIDTEADTRKSADDELQAAIDTEADTRKNADDELQANIDAETSARTESDEKLQTAIEEEASTRKSADDELQTNIDAEASAREDADNVLTENLEAETAARKDADDTLQKEIDELNQNVEDTYETKEEAKTSHEELQASIDSETAAREGADTTLQSNIDTEADTRKSADDELQAAIDSETAEREASETTIWGAITAEVQARIEGDDALQAEIDALEQGTADTYETKEDAQTAHDELQSEIDTKQDTLEAGFGIDITDNVISTTLDTNPFVFVEELPTEGMVSGKIYCVPNPESTADNNIWDEYTWTGEAWEEVGTYIPQVDLEPYEKIEDADKSHEELKEAIDKEASAREEADSALEQKIDDLDAATVKVADFITEAEIDEMIANLPFDCNADPAEPKTLVYPDGKYLDANTLYYLLKQLNEKISGKKYLKVSPQHIRWFARGPIHYDVRSNTDWEVE